MKTTILLTALVGLLGAAGHAQNAPIIWGAPTPILGTSDVSTVGSLVGTWAPGDDAYNPDSLPVNGVTFNAYGSGPFNSLVSSSGINDHYTGYNSPGTPDANYNTILQAAVYSSISESERID